MHTVTVVKAADSPQVAGVDSPLNLYVMSEYDDRVSDDEIWGVIESMKRFWAAEQRRYQARLTKQFAASRPNWETYNLDIYLDDREAN